MGIVGVLYVCMFIKIGHQPGIDFVDTTAYVMFPACYKRCHQFINPRFEKVIQGNKWHFLFILYTGRHLHLVKHTEFVELPSL